MCNQNVENSKELRKVMKYSEPILPLADGETSNRCPKVYCMHKAHTYILANSLGFVLFEDEGGKKTNKHVNVNHSSHKKAPLQDKVNKNGF